MSGDFCYALKENVWQCFYLSKKSPLVDYINQMDKHFEKFSISEVIA